MWRRHHVHVPVAVVDVGSNTVRLQVFGDGRTQHTEREMLRLGADIELHGEIPADKLHLTTEVVARFVEEGGRLGASPIEILIASPGRQARNGEALRAELERATGCRARILSPLEEGRLAFAGALSVAGVPSRRTIAVVDVGGGSAQIVVGSRRGGSQWAQSIDIGSQRLTSRMLSSDPPGSAAIGAARAEVGHYLDRFQMPSPHTTLAVGGSARALKRIVGPRLGIDELDHVLEMLADNPSNVVAERYEIGEERARTLAAGAVILSEIQHRLGTPLKVSRGGLREGAVLTLLAEAAAAA
jgi:exopolyphosphatase/guanosine-5'-triphosphate,3'-diphosphate pyrophosphatase